MNKIKVFKPVKAVIAEKIKKEGDIQSIEKGSNIYCGDCGRLWGTALKDIPFPLSIQTLKEHCINKGFKTSSKGILCVRNRNDKHLQFALPDTFEVSSLEIFQDFQDAEVAKALGQTKTSVK